METCPNCGYCPHCKRSNQPEPVWPLYPIYPTWPNPWWQSPHPYTTWTVDGGTETITTSHVALGNTISRTQ